MHLQSPASKFKQLKSNFIKCGSVSSLQLWLDDLCPDNMVIWSILVNHYEKIDQINICRPLNLMKMLHSITQHHAKYPTVLEINDDSTICYRKTKRFWIHDQMHFISFCGLNLILKYCQVLRKSPIDLSLIRFAMWLLPSLKSPFS